MDCPDRCVQRVEEMCPYQCSDWVGGSHMDANNVCLNVSFQLPTLRAGLQPPPFQCTGGVSHAGSSISCPENKSLLNYTKCRQIKVNYCTFNCEKYLTAPNQTTPTQDTSVVCQNLDDEDPENYQACMPLPCSMAFHKAGARAESAKFHKALGTEYENYKKSQVCKQTLLICPNICSKGPYPLPAHVCFDNNQWGTGMTYEQCSDPAENGDVCPGDTLRCIPRTQPKSKKKIDAGNSPRLNRLLATGHKSNEPMAGEKSHTEHHKSSKPMAGEKSHTENHKSSKPIAGAKAHMEHQKHVHRPSVMRRDAADVAE